jgi:hypothetical protein
LFFVFSCQAFPIPGVYHFRFLKNIGTHIVWFDIADDAAVLPIFQGGIFSKVSRIAAPSSSASSSTSTKSGFSPSKPQQQQQQQQPSGVPRAPSNDSNGVPPSKAPKPVIGDRRNSEKLLKFDDEVSSPISAPVAGMLWIFVSQRSLAMPSFNYEVLFITTVQMCSLHLQVRYLETICWAWKELQPPASRYQSVSCK